MPRPPPTEPRHFPAALGKPISDPVLLELPEPVFKKKSLTGRVLYADRFGNLITNLSRKVIKRYFQQGN